MSSWNEGCRNFRLHIPFHYAIVIVMEKGGRRMARQIIELYSEADMTRLRRRIKRWRAALWLFAAFALAVCLRLIVLTGTENAARMEGTVIAVSTVAGWVVIYCSVFVVTAGQRELSHANMLHSENRQIVWGSVAVTNERVSITRSITARRVEVSGDGETHRLLVCESRADELAAAGAVALYTAHGYVAAYEVTP